MNKFVSILGLAILALTTIVSADQSFVLWNSKPIGLSPELQVEYGIDDYDGLLDWAVLYNYYIPRSDNYRAWDSLDNKYKLQMFELCDWSLPATEFRPKLVYPDRGMWDSNAECQLIVSGKKKPVVEVVAPPVLVDVNETETLEELTEEVEVEE